MSFSHAWERSDNNIGPLLPFRNKEVKPVLSPVNGRRSNRVLTYLTSRQRVE